MPPLVDEVFELKASVRRFFSDGLGTYRELVYKQGQSKATHDVAPGKEQTYTVEGTNADFRCYVSLLARRSRCFPRNFAKFRSILRLFITCYNHCCLSRIKYPDRKTHPSEFLPALF